MNFICLCDIIYVCGYYVPLAEGGTFYAPFDTFVSDSASTWSSFASWCRASTLASTRWPRTASRRATSSSTRTRRSGGHAVVTRKNRLDLKRKLGSCAILQYLRVRSFGNIHCDSRQGTTYAFLSSRKLSERVHENSSVTAGKSTLWCFVSVSGVKLQEAPRVRLPSCQKALEDSHSR